ncbi:mechanosensitive ion channel family protein [Sulfurovum sp. CS9]|uniref:mechanosensitive ion channel family protein n=1 Tax=Sulfurovum sp. CS9 TaxID=3391146 RepID=UPI0039E830A6
MFSFIFFILMFTQIHAEYKPFIKAQLALIHQMNEDNITQDEVKQIVHKQELIYIEAFEKFLLNKKFILNQPKRYQEELFVLNKLLKHNKAHGNKYAVIRDEVLIKSYQTLQAQHRMSRHILRILNHYDYDEFDAKMNNEFVKNQEAIQKINTVDYKPFLKLKENNKVLQEAQKNIKDYYALLEINADVLRYFSIFEKRMYRLNKYAQYKILPIALYLDHTEWGKSLNAILYPHNLSIVKLLLILFISLFLYFIRTQLYKLVERLLYRMKYLQKYSKEIMSDAYKPINVLFMVINLHMVIHIYHNFYSVETLTRFFNIVYAILFTLILYRILNTIASIRINDMDQSDKKIKSEMVNVGIKIINFLIMIMGILLVMHFAGANLATVLSGLGIGGFAIALAARESLSNFLGTISILMSDTFSQGDWIVVDEKQGTVVEIGLRVTTLRTFDNALIAIPNGTIANQDVKNWSKRTLGRRIKMSLGIKYDSKPENIRRAISEIRGMLKTHPNIATDETNYEQNKHKSTKLVSQEDSLGVKRTLLVYLDELSDSSINILVYCFTKKTDWSQWLETKEDVIYKIMNILEKNHLEFAYPSMSLYHENKE